MDRLSQTKTNDAYPLPLVDEVQDRLSRDTIFATLDLHSGYWQVPVNQGDQEKIAFSPGPGMDGLVPIQKDAIWSIGGAQSHIIH